MASETEIERMVVRLIGDGRSYQRMLRQAESNTRRTGGRIQRISGVVKRFGAGLLSFGTSIARTFARLAVVGSGLLAVMAGFGIKLAGELEQSEIAFATFLNSTALAKKVLKDLTDFAATTPFQLPELERSGKALAAVGFSANEIVPVLRRIGDVAAGTGTSVEELAQVFARMRSIGRIQAEELNRFMDRGIPIVQELAANFGVTAVEIRKMASEGKINFKDLEKAFNNLSSEGGKFFNLTSKQSQSFLGLWSTLKDNLSLLLRDIGQVLIEELDMKSLLTGMISFIENFRSRFVTPFRVGVAVAVFAFKNWRKIVTLAMLKVGLKLVSFVEDLKFLFIKIIPAIIRGLPAMFKLVFTNILTNASNFGKALISAIKGKGFDFIFTELGEAFEKELKKIPKLAERQLSFAEKTAKGAIGVIQRELEQGLVDTIAEARQPRGEGGGLVEPLVEAEEAAKKTAEAVKGIGRAQKVSAAAFGSAEALTRVQEFRVSQRERAGSGSTADNTKRTADAVEQLVEMEKNKDQLSLTPANIG